MPVERLPLLAHRLPQPFADDRAVHVVVVNPALVARVVGGVDVDALHLPGVIRKERLERDKIVALHDQIAVARFTAGEVGYVLEQAKGDFLVVAHHCLFPDPVQCRHGEIDFPSVGLFGTNPFGAGWVHGSSGSDRPSSRGSGRFRRGHQAKPQSIASGTVPQAGYEVVCEQNVLTGQRLERWHGTAAGGSGSLFRHVGDVVQQCADDLMGNFAALRQGLRRFDDRLLVRRNEQDIPFRLLHLHSQVPQTLY